MWSWPLNQWPWDFSLERWAAIGVMAVIIWGALNFRITNEFRRQHRSEKTVKRLIKERDELLHRPDAKEF